MVSFNCVVNFKKQFTEGLDVIDSFAAKVIQHNRYIFRRGCSGQLIADTT